MANIVAVRLENFQSHLDTLIEFDRGLNVIVGQSDSGKTAILRGIRWVLYNQPRGVDFMRVGADFVRVTVTFDHGVSIIRERTSSKNRYIIKKSGEDDLILEGFGVHVPKEVIDAHGMDYLRIDQDLELMIHLSQQLDGPFLLEQTNVVRAKTLGRISGAHYLDMAARDTGKDIIQLNQRIRHQEEEVEELHEKLRTFSNLDTLKKQLEHANLRIESVKLLEKRRLQFEQLKEKIEQIDREMNEAKQKKQLVSKLDRWTENYYLLETKNERLNRLKKKKIDIDHISNEIRKNDTILQKTAQIENANKKYEHIRSLLTKYVQLHTLQKDWNALETSIKFEQNQLRTTHFIDQIDEDIVETMTKKQQLYKTLVSFYEKLKKIDEEKSRVVTYLNRLPNIEKTNDVIEKVEQLHNRLFTLKTLFTQLHELDGRMKEGRAFIEKKEQEQKEAEKRYNERLQIEGTCPTCGQKICMHEEEWI